MSRPPLAPKITDTLYDMYEDAKKVNDLTSESELERKLAIIRSVNEKITNQLSRVNQSTRPDKFMKRKLETALEENVTIQSTVENSLNTLRGAGDRLALSSRTEEYARQVADLQRILAERQVASDTEKRILQSRLQALQKSSGELQQTISDKERELQTLRTLQQNLPDGQKLQSRIDDLVRTLEGLRASHSTEMIEKSAELASLTESCELCRQSLTANGLISNQLQIKIRELEGHKTGLEVELERLNSLPTKVEESPELPELRERLRKMERDLSDAIKNKEQTETIIRAQTAEIHDFQQRLSSISDELSDCKRAIGERTVELESLRKDLSESQRERELLQKKIFEMEKDFAERIEKNLGETRLEISKLNQSLKELGESHSSVQQKQSDLQETDSSNKGRISELEQQLSREKESGEAQITELRGQLEKLTLEEQRVKKDLTSTAASLQEAVDEKEKLDLLTQSISKENEDLKKEMGVLNQELSDRSASSSDLDKQTRELRQQVESLERDAETRTRELEQKAQEIVSLKQQSQDTRVEIKNLKTLLQEKESKEEETLDQLSSLSRELDTTRREKETLEASQKQSQESLADLQTRITQEEARVQAKSQELEQRKRELDQLSLEVSSVKEELSQKNTELEKVQVDKRKIEAASVATGTQLSEREASCRQKEVELLAQIEMLKQKETALEDTLIQNKQVSVEAQNTLRENIRIRIQDHERQLEELRAKHQKESGTDLARIADLESQLVAVRSELTKVQSDTESKGSRVQELEKALKEKEVELEGQLVESQRQLEEKVTGLSQLSESSKNELQQAIVTEEKRATAAIALKENEIAALTSELQSIEDRLRKESEERSKSDAKIGDLTSTIEHLQENLARDKVALDLKSLALEQMRNSYNVEKESIQKEFDSSKEKFMKEKEVLEKNIQEIEQKSTTERESFQQARDLLEGKLQLSEQEKAEISQRASDSNRTVEDLRQELQERGREISDNQRRIQDYEKSVTEAAKSSTAELERHQKSLADLQEKYQKQILELGEEKIREQASLQTALDAVTVERDTISLTISKLREEKEGLSKQLEEKKSEIERLDKEKREQLELFATRLKEKCPSAVGDLQEILLEGFHKAEVSELQQEEIDLIKSNMENTLKVYQAMTDSKLEQLDIRGIGISGMRQYILLSIYLFHGWKAVLRLPLLLRGGTKDEEKVDYRYEIPTGKEEEQLIKMINTQAIKDNYKSSIVEGKIRIDIMLYYCVIALSHVVDRLPNEAEFNEFISYLKKLLEQSNNILSALVGRVGDINKTIEKRLRIEHDQQTPIITFVRLSSKTPQEINKRFNYDIIEDKTFRVEYSDEPIAFYEKSKATGDFTDTGVKPNYNSDYYFGPFTHVFPPSERNDAIANSDIFKNSIEKRLLEGQPVCIIGYGASGSGKTTTLIYADYMTMVDGKSVRVREPGILILLANNLSSSYDHCAVTIYELEADPSIKEEKNVTGICRKYPARDESKTIRRLTRTGKTAGGDDIFLDNLVPYEDCDKKTDFSLEYELTEGEWKNREGEGIEKQLVEYINVKRNIAPSPNNPQSSRSHIICILTFLDSKTRRTTSLIVCDFAGVENKFNCADKAALENMGLPRFVELEKQKLLDSVKLGGLNVRMDKDVSDAIATQLADTTIPFEYIKTPNVRVLSDEELGLALEFCSQIINRLRSSDITETTAIGLYKQLIGSDKLMVRANFDITKIKDYRIIPATTETNKKFKQGGIAYLPIFNEAVLDAGRYDKGFSIINYYYEIFIGTKVEQSSLISIIRMIIWFLYSYNLEKERKKISISNLLKQSKLSQDIRSRVKIPNDDARYLLTETVIEQNIKTSICQVRVNEGIFINKSLSELRKFIGDTMQASKLPGSVAPFIDKCAPLQCNPYYRDCFGQNDYYDARPKTRLGKASEYGLLSEYIASVDKSKDMIFCVMNVVNLSKDANNPPPSPYVDISDLQIEYEKLLTYNIGEKLETGLGLNRSVTSKIISICDRILVKMSNLRVPIALISEITGLVTLIRENRGIVLSHVGQVIEKLTNFNAITAIGTLEFTDMMAKYAVNRVTCNTREQKSGITPPRIRVEEEERKSQSPVGTPVGTPTGRRSSTDGRTFAQAVGGKTESDVAKKLAREGIDQSAIIQGGRTRNIMKP